jgi:hypothetical protein
MLPTGKAANYHYRLTPRQVGRQLVRRILADICQSREQPRQPQLSLTLR